MTISHVLAIAVGVAVTALAREAAACSPAPVLPPSVAFPADGARDVPINPLLWVMPELDRDSGSTWFVLRDDDGEETSLVFTTLGHEAPQILLDPELPLATSTHYELFACTESDGCDHFISAFTTGNTDDELAPALPEELDRRSGRSTGACGDRFSWVELDMDFDGVLVVDLGMPQLDEQRLTGMADAISIDSDRGVRVTDELGPSGEHVHARAGAFDQAGNFSGWVELAPLDLEGCGCAASGHDRGGVALLALLLLCAPRRQRAAPEPSIRRDRAARAQ